MNYSIFDKKRKAYVAVSPQFGTSMEHAWTVCPDVIYSPCISRKEFDGEIAKADPDLAAKVEDAFKKAKPDKRKRSVSLITAASLLKRSKVTVTVTIG